MATRILWPSGVPAHRAADFSGKTAAAVSAQPVQQRLQVALGGRTTDVAISQAFSVATWRMAATIASVERNLIQPVPSLEFFHGAYGGSGLTRAVPISTDDIPEGGLMNYLGSGYLEVTDAGGYLVPGEADERALDLGGGAIRISGFIQTDTNDGTVRCLWSKLEGTGFGSGDGIAVALENGGLRFRMNNGGTIFDFTRGAVDDGALHDWVCMFSGNASPHEARIYIDGVQSGAAVTGLGSTEAPATSVNVRMGQFLDGSGQFADGLYLVGISREWDTDFPAALHATRAWTTITSDTYGPVGPIEASRGVFSRDPLQSIATPGTMTFAMNNLASAGGRLQGAYTPGHPNATAGWLEGAPCRWQWSIDGGSTWRTVWHGFLDNVTPDAGRYARQAALVTCKTWLQRALQTPVRTPPVQTDLTSDDAARYALDQADRPPPAIDFALGDAVFAYAFDDIPAGTPLLEVLGRCARSEGGGLTEQRDGTLVYESRTSRYLVTAPAADWDESVYGGFGAERGRALVLNVLRGTCYPRRVGSAGTVVGSVPRPIEIPPGTPVDFEIPYQDPAQEAASVGALTVITPVITTDFTMNDDPDGVSGADLSSYATVAILAHEAGGSAAKLRVTSSHPSVTGYFLTQLRATPLYRFRPETIEARDEESVRAHDTHEGSLDMPMQSDAGETRSFLQMKLALWSQPFQAARTAMIVAADAARIQQLYDREILDQVTNTETMTGVAGDRAVIQGIRYTWPVDGLPSATYMLAPLTDQAFEILDEVGFAELDTMAIA